MTQEIESANCHSVQKENKEVCGEVTCKYGGLGGPLGSRQGRQTNKGVPWYGVLCSGK